MRSVVLKYLIFLTVPLMAATCALAQQPDSARRPAIADTTPLPPDVIRPVYGPYDTIIVSAQVYDRELLSARTMPYTWVTAPMTPAMRRRLEEWTRLRNAVYVTYPYARKAGVIINDINSKM